MTFHQALVIYAGMAFFIAGLFTLGIWQMLSPSDRGRLTFGWLVRSIVFLHGLACIGRGITLIFPGRLVATEYMSPMVPLAATTTLLVATVVAELLQRYRLPPPLMERFIRALLAFRADGQDSMVEVAMAGGIASPKDLPAPEATEVRLGSPRLRWVVLTAAGLGLLIVFLVVLSAAAATLPRS